MRKKFAITLLSFCLGSFISEAQVPKVPTKEEIAQWKKDAGDAFKNKIYSQSLNLYKKLVDVEPSNSEFNYRLGVSYLNTNVDKKKAIEYLETASQQKDSPKDIDYDLGVAYHYVSEFEKSAAAFEKFKKSKGGNPNPKLEVSLRMEWNRNAPELMKNPIEVAFKNLGKGVNTAYAEIRPVTGADDSVLVFTTMRKGTMGGLTDEMGDFPSDIFISVINDSVGGRGKAKNPGININSEVYDESLSMNAAGDKMLIYREGYGINGDIFLSELKGKAWQKAASLGEAFVSKELETGACLSPDGKTLYFSSDMKGTKGGKDLWMCTKEGATWSKPVNLGEPINTKYDEDNPALFADGVTLFFSSRGHNSMGGYDLFMTKYEASRGWQKPQNIGYPLNTLYDDQYFTLSADGKSGYISALRDSGFGDMDIYKVTFAQPLVNTSLRIVKFTIMTPAGGAGKNLDVVITNKSTGALMGEFVTNSSTGKFIAALPAGEYKINVKPTKLGRVLQEFIIDETEEGKIEKVFTLAFE